MSASALPVPIAQFKPVCSNCGWRELCLPAGLSLEELARIERFVSARRKVKRGHSLYQVDDPFAAVYAVWKGFFKSNAYLEDGREQVTGFHMPGDLIGVDGINADRHTCNAIALEDSDVCVIPFSRFEELSNEVPRLRRQFHVMMSRGMARGQAAMLLLGSMYGDQRLASFLLNMSQRVAARGQPSSELHLCMTRLEIGSFLGLTFETVSRFLSKFHEERLISIHRRTIRILETAGLRNIIAGPSERRSAYYANTLGG